jgi:hypothetical protein
MRDSVPNWDEEVCWTKRVQHIFFQCSPRKWKYCFCADKANTSAWKKPAFVWLIYHVRDMKKRLLVAAFLLLVTTCLVQALPIQEQAGLQQLAEVQTSSPQASSPQPTPTPAAKPSATPTAFTRSSTVGDPTSSAPLNVGGKFRYFAVESFRPGIYPVAAFYDGLTMANPPKAYPREWRQGLPAFGRNYGDFMSSWVSVQGGKFVAASLMHEDPRYFSSTSKNFFARCFNAARYTVIDRGDNGHARLAVANISGAFAGGFVGNAYLPDPYANTSHALSRSALALSGFATSNLADEFRPEIHMVLKKLHLPSFGY